MSIDAPNKPAAHAPPQSSAQKYLLTVEEFERMYEVGIFSETDRLELFDGEIYVMSPIGPMHIFVVNRLNKLLVHLAGDDAIVSVQNSIHLNTHSEPEPDFVLLEPADEQYKTKVPAPRNVLLLIEVANTSLSYDRKFKLPRYAADNVPEVWIVDVENQIIEQYSEPHAGGYNRMERIVPGKRIRATKVPSVEFAIDQLFS